jgi:glycosyltransferase involved in cell wall biosynthesis
MLIKFLNNKQSIINILNWNYSLLYKIIIFLIQIKKNTISVIKWKFKNYTNIEWIKEFNISTNSFNSTNKKKWFSAFWRLYNSEEFLEKTVESHINLFDEIILVNNFSIDNTEKICKKLEKKYPSKIKFYNYPFEIYKIWTKEYKLCEENSVHSLSYYYNWTLSKTNYEYVIKLDDDHIVIEKNISNIINKIRLNWLNHFLQLPLLNIYNINDKLSFSYNDIKSSFAWLFWDFGFFKISERTYFIKQKNAESLIFPYKIKTDKISFLHLKWLKKDMWLKNYWKIVQKRLKDRIQHNNFKTLNDNYIEILKRYWIK